MLNPFSIYRYDLYKERKLKENQMKAVFNTYLPYRYYSREYYISHTNHIQKLFNIKLIIHNE